MGGSKETKYDPKKIEPKWQDVWQKKQVFNAKQPNFTEEKLGPKYYTLVEFPFPSGQGLHVGHCRSYVGMDIISRKKRMEGLNVMFPIGWDSFGLPTENYAIKTGIHPAVATKENTANFKKQLHELGISFDWSREIDTSDPDYFKWTQWIFIQLFKNGLAYKDKILVNWCPSCKIVLANEEVVSGNCERCGSVVVKKEKEQWLIKITEYAERLLNDLDLVDYPERVKSAQREWIGKSNGYEIKFEIGNLKSQISVFTTRVDTIFGATYLVLAPEHKIIEEIKDKVLNFKQVQEYIETAKQKSELERQANDKEKTGIELLGVKAVNPANNIEIPIFVADYVLANYGVGAIMAVPAHDKRDFDFATKYDLPIIKVVESVEKQEAKENFFEEEEGVLINSDKFSGLLVDKAKESIGKFLEKKKAAKKAQYFKLRDWVFSRQRYWGEPIPMIFCQKCASIRKSQGAGWSPLKESELPLLLPEVKEYKPTEQGDSPLAKNEEWIKATCERCGEEARRETDVMPNWAGSNWYYLRYCDPKNNKHLADPRLLEYWMESGVDWYNGGMEHATLHLLYSRFIYKFLWDIGAVPKSIGPEPYKKRTSHGMVLGEGGVKMSKSKGNVINPLDVVKEYGADVFRIFEMFMGPFGDAIPWDSKGLVGAERFLEKVWKLQEKIAKKASSDKNDKLSILLNQTSKKISEDIDSLKFNTAISSLMILVNEMEKVKEIPLSLYMDFLLLLNPFAPHITEEIWSKLDGKEGGLCCEQKWPKFKESLLAKETLKLVVQVNGKTRDVIEIDTEASSKFSEKKAIQIAQNSEKVKKWIEKKKVKKVIFVPGKLINILV